MEKHFQNKKNNKNLQIFVALCLKFRSKIFFYLIHDYNIKREYDLLLLYEI